MNSVPARAAPQDPVDAGLQARRRQALLASEQCRRVLLEQFGARRAVVFGSLVGGGPWHAGSDLDLAVEGLPAEALRAAAKYLDALVPPWLRVDLVPMERASAQVLSHILEGSTMPDDPFLALGQRLDDEVGSLARVVDGVGHALSRCGNAPDEFDTRALASYVEDFYSGCERLCERVAVTLDGGVVAGDGWHRLLLRQMAAPGGHGRPPLFDGMLLLDLDEYRRFRHRHRHLYGYELESEQVLALARGVAATFDRVSAAVTQFRRWPGPG